MVYGHGFYDHYQEIYTKYTALYGSQVGVFYRKGNFYELFGQQDPKTGDFLNNAKEIADMCVFQITTYPGGAPKGRDGLTTGFPYYRLDGWASFFVRQGWHIVVVDEIRDTAGNVDHRAVTKVLSPGTHIDTHSGGGEGCSIGILWYEPKGQEAPHLAAVSIELGTGAVHMHETAATGQASMWHSDTMRHFFHVFQPNELVVVWRGNELEKPDATEIRHRLTLPTTTLQFRCVSPEAQGVLEQAPVREEYLQRCFKPRTSLPLRIWLHLDPGASSKIERALVVLLQYIEDHVPRSSDGLLCPQVWNPSTHVELINNALTQLNILGSSHSTQTYVKDLFVTPKTAMGKRALLKRLCMPLTNAQEIRHSHDQIEWLLTNPVKAEGFQKGLLSISDMSRLHRLVLRGCPETQDCWALYQSYTSTEFLLSVCATTTLFDSHEPLQRAVSSCQTEFMKLFDIGNIRKALDDKKQDERSCLLESCGPLAKKAEQAIIDIYTKVETWRQDICKAYHVDLEATSWSPMDKQPFTLSCTKTALKIFLTKRALLEKQGITMKQVSGGGRIECALFEECLEQLTIQKSNLQRALAKELPKACIAYTEATQNLWQQIEEWIVRIDLALCFARTADVQRFCRPLIENCDASTPSGVWIEHLRHPLIETQSSKIAYKTHTIDLGYSDQEKGGWLLYGMNASGKSSLMKAVGIAVLLAQVGCYIPGTAMRLRPFHRIATRILNQDNLWAGLSSFAVEISELRDMFQSTDHKTLVLGDELCAGTESVSATAIVASGISYLRKAKTRFVLATHLHDLTKLPSITSSPSIQIWHLHVEWDRVKDRLIYHRDLRPGPGTTLYGLEVAKALHLPQDMLEEAYSIRKFLLQETALEEKSKSHWNTKIARQQCEVCKKSIESELEVHHIQERERAKSKRANQDGTALHGLQNTVVLCQECHDKEHSGTISVGQVELTSEGPARTIVSLDSFRYMGDSESKTLKKKKASLISSFTDEEQDILKRVIQEKSRQHTPVSIIGYTLRNTYSIAITDLQVKKLMGEGF